MDASPKCFNLLTFSVLAQGRLLLVYPFVYQNLFSFYILSFRVVSWPIFRFQIVHYRIHDPKHFPPFKSKTFFPTGSFARRDRPCMVLLCVAENTLSVQALEPSRLATGMLILLSRLNPKFPYEFESKIPGFYQSYQSFSSNHVYLNSEQSRGD
jgi:hypothetical protein